MSDLAKKIEMGGPISASLKVINQVWPPIYGREDQTSIPGAQLRDSLGLEVIHHISAIRYPGGAIQADVLVSTVGHELLQEINHACHL